MSRSISLELGNSKIYSSYIKKSEEILICKEVKVRGMRHLSLQRKTLNIRVSFTRSIKCVDLLARFLRYRYFLQVQNEALKDALKGMFNITVTL